MHPMRLMVRNDAENTNISRKFVGNTNATIVDAMRARAMNPKKKRAFGRA